MQGIICSDVQSALSSGLIHTYYMISSCLTACYITHTCPLTGLSVQWDISHITFILLDKCDSTYWKVPVVGTWKTWFWVKISQNMTALLRVECTMKYFSYNSYFVAQMWLNISKGTSCQKTWFWLLSAKWNYVVRINILVNYAKKYIKTQLQHTQMNIYFVLSILLFCSVWVMFVCETVQDAIDLFWYIEVFLIYQVSRKKLTVANKPVKRHR